MLSSSCRLLFGLIFALSGLVSAGATELGNLLPQLKQGGFVIVFRHAATDNAQQDVYPFNFDNMQAQRQLSETGRSTARAIGAAMQKLGVPIGEVKTSKLNRAIETGRLLSGKDGKTFDELTDSGAGSASAMANPQGQNEAVGEAIRTMISLAPGAALNTIIVTHKTNIADAFSKEWPDPKETEAAIFNSVAGSPPVFIGRLPADEWTRFAQ